ncbi:SDR family oxidoreductase [Tumebacillus flagellatus]|uniref:Oxidoreductase n=1 Tax=Tumebacillus flagellatus TaxID=1157490 RepID=A0A074LKV4_9BACL|nr:SDR family oxidoreductase [Tumebacillus flagellatus]KEO81175.1 hypothetical protein EL26_22220 [Tumebacillus flagellatus]
MKLQGKTAIVTGGGRGIGAATALELGAQGANVIVNYVGNAEAAASVVAEIQKAGGQAHAVQANVTVEADVQKLVDETLATFGRLGQPDDLSKVIAFLASDDSKYMTSSYTSVNVGSLMDL